MSEWAAVQVYPGANGVFKMYEDDGKSREYQQGGYGTITLTWSDSSNTLAIGKREGSFQGLDKHTFNVVLVGVGHGVGVMPTKVPDKVVSYSGEAVEIVLKATKA